MQMEFSDDFFAGVLRVNISDIPGFNSLSLLVATFVV